MILDGQILSFPDGAHHEYNGVSFISYFPDGKQMISGSYFDRTIRRWGLREGKEIEEAREVCEYGIEAVGVSRDGRWVVTAGREVKVSDVDTGTVRTFNEDPGDWIFCIDISADNRLLAGGSYSGTARIWSLDTGELVAGPFKLHSDECVGMSSLRFSGDSQKLAVLAFWGRSRCLQVWDVQAQKLDVQISNPNELGSIPPIFWTTKDKSIVAPISFIADDLSSTIYELDASTLKTVGAPFKGHTHTISGLALSFDCVLLVSSDDDTIKLWTFESRQLIASFDVESRVYTLILSPDSRQLAYTDRNDCNIMIYMCNIPTNVLARIGLAEKQQPSKRSRRIVDVPLAPGKLRYATAGAPGPDDGLIRDEDYISPPPSPNPDSRQPSTAKVANAGDHGSG
ncbi:hypothetical protein F4604DRAFT_1951509 [Suillus subluteus]|nr:hypothetical protein F4604DRAFT_1951509 [Suillus subluteus]